MSMFAVNYAADPWPGPPLTPPVSGKVENILLVDDLPGNLLVYRTILEELGQNLVTARSGEEALKLVLQQEFAVILLDVNMATMNGFETASLIRKRKKSSRTPIIFLTAFTDEMNMIQGYASGAVDYLPTPVVAEVLKAKVRVFIELSQMRRQAALQAEERVRREAAEELARTSAFLAQVSESLSRSQSHKELLRTLAQLPLLHLADISIVWFKDSEAHIDQIEWGHASKMPGDDGEKPAPLLSDFPWLEETIHKVMTTGQARILDEIPASKNAHRFSKALGSAIVLPLAVLNQARGAIVLGRKAPHSPHLVKDLSLANDLAYRAGVALENVLLMERIREADRRKDEFLGMLAHELRNPLGPICNSLQLQRMLDPKDLRHADLRDIIERQVRHMGRLIDDLLDATRLAHGKILLRKERCDLDKIVRQTAEDYRSIVDAGGMNLEISAPEKPVWITGDPTRLVQAVGNLLHNAHKFTKRGGTISIKLNVEKENQSAFITVSDTGIGIEPEMLRWVFDVFRQAEQGLDRSRGGLGLGLALVKGLVELHGGHVEASSPGPDMGAEFTIHLPLEPCVAPAVPDGAVQPVSSAQKHRILIIEDNRDAAESIRMLLHLEGHDVKTASTALAGMEAARIFHPQVILCDIGLPEMDGYQIVRMIRQDAALSSAYIIALTGYGREKDQRQALDAGFDLHLTKPMDYNNLRQALARRPFNWMEGSST